MLDATVSCEWVAALGWWACRIRPDIANPSSRSSAACIPQKFAAERIVCTNKFAALSVITRSQFVWKAAISCTEVSAILPTRAFGRSQREFDTI